MKCWVEQATSRPFLLCRDLPRRLFLGLLRDAAVVVGNSSSGIIEAASFHVPAVDIGPRQAGRQRSRNVVHCGYEPAAIRRHLQRIWNKGRPRRLRCRNVYGGGKAGERLADSLGGLGSSGQILRKLIRY
jgi:UDP-N-acetylglucosamine 2-epimerase